VLQLTFRLQKPFSLGPRAPQIDLVPVLVRVECVAVSCSALQPSFRLHKPFSLGPRAPQIDLVSVFAWV